MAKGSLAILKSVIDVQTVIDELNAALSEEWLAYYQYWVGAAVVVGLQRSEVEKEFLEHAQEEFNHANLLSQRLKELDAVPVLDPQEWFKLARCTYDPPKDPEVTVLLKQNIIAERCAIARYQEIAKLTEGKDFVTCDLAKFILAEEEDHEQDLVDFITDIDSAMEIIKAKLDIK
ncbi:MAG: ferritin-like domain-containing protein [Bacteroidales bacterium]|nr:ferritin-like domain-containing protein [Bacteroidales bacterium]